MSGAEFLMFCDVETTGLDPVNDYLLEVAAVITDLSGNLESEPINRVIYQDKDAAYAQANDYVKEMHTRTGLWGKLEFGSAAFSVDQWMLDGLQEFGPAKSIRMAGNSIRLDLNFLERNLPKTYNHLSYRSVDCSALEYALLSWGIIEETFPKKYTHNALEDVMESIEQYKWLRRASLDYDPLRHLAEAVTHG